MIISREEAGEEHGEWAEAVVVARDGGTVSEEDRNKQLTYNRIKYK